MARPGAVCSVKLAMKERLCGRGLRDPDGQGFRTSVTDKPAAQVNGHHKVRLMVTPTLNQALNLITPKTNGYWTRCPQSFQSLRMLFRQTDFLDLRWRVWLVGNIKQVIDHIVPQS